MAFMARGFNSSLWLSGIYLPNQAVHDQMMPHVHFSCHYHHHYPAPGTATTVATGAYYITPSKYLVFLCLSHEPSQEHLAMNIGFIDNEQDSEQQWKQGAPRWVATQICLPPPTSSSAHSPTTCHITDEPVTIHVLLLQLPHQHHLPPLSFTSTTSVATSVSPLPLLSHLLYLHCWSVAQNTQLCPFQTLPVPFCQPAPIWNPTDTHSITSAISKPNSALLTTASHLKTHWCLFRQPTLLKKQLPPIWNPNHLHLKYHPPSHILHHQW